MKIAIDIRTLSKPKFGIGHYVQDLIDGLKIIENSYEFHLLHNKGYVFDEIKKDPGFCFIKNFFSHENHLMGDIWEHTILPLRLKKRGISLFHGPSYIIPLVKNSFKTVSTIHDLIFFSHPEMVPLKYGIYMRYLVKKITKSADLIITDSTSTKSDLINILKVPEEKIRVVYLSVNNKYHKLKRMGNRIKTKFKIKKKYLLFVGDIQPKKNLPGLLEAFSLLPKRIQNEYQIVVAGKKNWSFEKVEESLKNLNLNNKVIFTGYLPEEDILLLYNSADIFVFPSLCEGFGLPVLEAMSCGVPVITSNVSSLPEITGNAAILVDPNNAEELAHSIISLAEDPVLRQKKIEAGLKQASFFSVKRMAAETIKVYQELA